MKHTNSQENPFLNLIINIFLPVLILNKGGEYLNPRWTLIIALLFPLCYGIQDYVRRKHKNYVSLIGMMNILLTGGLALMDTTGIWFAVKEASLPLILGLLVLGSTWTKNPAAKMLFCNPQVLNMDAIELNLVTYAKQTDFQNLLKKTTLWLSVSFFISSVLNFLVALFIFKDISPDLVGAARETVLNDQIAKMTWMGFVVIALPLMLFTGALVYLFLKRVSEMTQMPIHSLLKS